MISNNNIIHIFDDDKFIDSSIKLIESVYPNQSKYFVVKNTDSAFRYVKSNKVERISLRNTNEIINFSEYILENKVKAVFFHALNDYKQKLAIQLPKNVVKVWFIWGYDLYSNWVLFKKKMYEKETIKGLKNKKYHVNFKKRLIFNHFSFQLFKKSENLGFFMPNKLKKVLYSNYNDQFYKAAKTMDIVVPVVPTEYKLITKMNLKAVCAPFNYGCLEDLLDDKLDKNVLNAKNILIGNSADPANNHIDIFKKIANIDLEGRKIYVPLSYGGDKEYIAFVIEKGKICFGSNFVPLINFTILEKYNEILMSCGFMIFNHIRQQGVGNIISLGYMGAKIFLHEKSPVYDYYSKIGLEVYATQRITNNSLEENLSYELYKKNKEILFEYYSQKAVQIKIKELFTIVESFS